MSHTQTPPLTAIHVTPVCSTEAPLKVSVHLFLSGNLPPSALDLVALEQIYIIILLSSSVTLL